MNEVVRDRRNQGEGEGRQIDNNRRRIGRMPVLMPSDAAGNVESRS